MTPDIGATLIRIQQQVVGHYIRLLRRSMPDEERRAITGKLVREESVLSELLAARLPGLVPGSRIAA
jgi:hypothetical protein